MANPIPSGYEGMIPYLIVPNSIEAMEVYSAAFDATCILRLPGPDGSSTMHAEMKIFNSVLMMTDENPAFCSNSPRTLGGTPMSIHIYVEDVDSAFQKAIDAGFTPIMPLMDAFWGDRFGKLQDPFGHQWSLASHKVDMTEEEVKAAGEAFMESMNSSED